MTDQRQRPGHKALRALRLVAHYEDWPPKAGRLFLNAARVGEDECRPFDRCDHLAVVNRLDEPDTRRLAKELGAIGATRGEGWTGQ